jgi:hypothetical protein
MGPNLQAEFQSMMAAMYGDGWQHKLQYRQVVDMQRTFMGGVVVAMNSIPIGTSGREQLLAECREFSDRVS